MSACLPASRSRPVSLFIQTWFTCIGRWTGTGAPPFPLARFSECCAFTDAAGAVAGVRKRLCCVSVCWRVSALLPSAGDHRWAAPFLRTRRSSWGAVETCSLRQRRQRSHRPPAEQESAVSGERSASSQEHSADGTALTSLFLLCRASTVMQKSSLTISCAPSVNLEQISRSLWMCYGKQHRLHTGAVKMAGKRNSSFVLFCF